VSVCLFVASAQHEDVYEPAFRPYGSSPGRWLVMTSIFKRRGRRCPAKARPQSARLSCRRFESRSKAGNGRTRACRLSVCRALSVISLAIRNEDDCFAVSFADMQWQSSFYNADLSVVRGTGTRVHDSLSDNRVLIVSVLEAQTLGWRSGVVVSTLASINEVNLRRARLVLRWTTESGFNSRWRTFISVCNQPDTCGQLSLPSFWGR